MRIARILMCFVLLMPFAACARNRSSAPKVDPELIRLTKEEAWEKAEGLFADKKWVASRRYYSHVYQMNPNDPLGRKSLLRVADTYFNKGDQVNLVEASYKYRDFINRYPGADSADYAMLQIARVSYKQMYKADRDQTKTIEALEKIKQMRQAYPNSSYMKEADELEQQALNRLARHEHIVARFYLKRGNADAAIRRFNNLVDRFPAYTRRDEMFFDLATALERAGRGAEAKLYLERVVSEFPKSEYAERAKQRLAASA